MCQITIIVSLNEYIENTQYSVFNSHTDTGRLNVEFHNLHKNFFLWHRRGELKNTSCMHQVKWIMLPKRNRE